MTGRDPSNSGVSMAKRKQTIQRAAQKKKAKRVAKAAAKADKKSKAADTKK